MSDVEEVDAAKEERLKEIWGDDKLGRRADADYLIRFLPRRMKERNKGEKSYVLNIDAAWGGGKSFFLKRLGKQMEEEGYLVARVNAWEDDYIEDPLISVMAAIEVEMGSLLEESEPLRSAWKEVRKYADPIVSAYAVGSGKFVSGPIQKFTGVNLFEVVQVWRKTRKLKQQASETIIDRFVEVKSVVGGFKKAFSTFLKKLNKKKKVPFFILVDEMDRCRPPYAISLLERVKHLFNIDNVIFVFATDTKQLSHSIGAVYGVGFDSEKYLQRFFDLPYSFEVPELERYVEFLVGNHRLDNANIIWEHSKKRSLSFHLAACFQSFELDLRSVDQCINILKNLVTAGEHDKVPIKGVVLLPMIIAHQQRSPKIDLPASQFQELFMEGRKRLFEWRVHSPSQPVRWDKLLEVYQITLSKLRSEGELARWKANNTNALHQHPETKDTDMNLWVIEQVELEISEAQKNPQMTEKTILELYPKIVRTAGRFAQLEP